MKRDIKRQKLAEAKNVPGLVARVNEMNSTALRRRTKMMLPAPQVNTRACRLCANCPVHLQAYKLGRQQLQQAAEGYACWRAA